MSERRKDGGGGTMWGTLFDYGNSSNGSTDTSSGGWLESASLFASHDIHGHGYEAEHIESDPGHHDEHLAYDDHHDPIDQGDFIDPFDHA
jgi:hypothetical protein